MAAARSAGAIAGATLGVFAILALTSPGRLDIVDGHCRYDVARSLVEHGDLVVRDPGVWFNVFPGRDGELYTYYRLPQTLLGALAITASDATGAVSEGRRHFCFVLTSAVAAALLVPLLTAWFRDRGQSLRAALGWAVLGVLSTPAWFYGTSTFDDILGTTSVVAGLVFAARAGSSSSMGWAWLTGCALGIAFHCKQPLGLFLAPALVTVARHRLDLRLVAAILIPFALLLVGFVAHDRYKFPPDTLAAHSAILATYAPVWSANPLVTVPLLLVSPGAGLAFYAPTTLLGLLGARYGSGDRHVVRATLLAAVGFFFFIAMMRIFKGDPAWGPRYLTPLVLVSWLWAPDGFRRMPRRVGVGVLVAGVVVQILAVSVDPHRLMVERGLPNAWTVVYPELLFHPATSHLLHRPREVLEILTDVDSATQFSPALTPTASVPMAQQIGRTSEDVGRYVILDELRPWWATYPHLRAEERPVPVAPTATVLVALLIGGTLLTAGLHSADDS